jgi:hypothetical protein
LNVRSAPQNRTLTESLEWNIHLNDASQHFYISD